MHKELIPSSRVFWFIYLFIYLFVCFAGGWVNQKRFRLKLYNTLHFDFFFRKFKQTKTRYQTDAEDKDYSSVFGSYLSDGQKEVIWRIRFRKDGIMFAVQHGIRYTVHVSSTNFSYIFIYISILFHIFFIYFHIYFYIISYIFHIFSYTFLYYFIYFSYIFIYISILFHIFFIYFHIHFYIISYIFHIYFYIISYIFHIFSYTFLYYFIYFSYISFVFPKHHQVMVSSVSLGCRIHRLHLCLRVRPTHHQRLS